MGFFDLKATCIYCEKRWGSIDLRRRMVVMP